MKKPPGIHPAADALLMCAFSMEVVVANEMNRQAWFDGIHGIDHGPFSLLQTSSTHLFDGMKQICPTKFLAHPSNRTKLMFIATRPALPTRATLVSHFLRARHAFWHKVYKEVKY